MPIDYERIRKENEKKYGTDVDRYGPVLLAHKYSERTHFIYELLQNAEDAGATEISFRLFQDRLEIDNNGRLFNEADVRGICGLVEGTKADDLALIGKFGIGFKSVYVYTRSPEVHSGSEAFAIDQYVWPRGVQPREVEDDRTLFVLPFDHEDVAADIAAKQIGSRLRNLGVRALLFLSHIEEISWVIEGTAKGTYLRDRTEDGPAERVDLLGQGPDGETDERWLVFQRDLEPSNHPELRVQVAFLLAADSDGGENVIVRTTDACLSAFLPTELQTNLGFLINGPYRTTPARDNISRDDKWNRALIRSTARLVVDALTRIRDMGLLTPSVLEALPIRVEQFPEAFIFRPIFDEVKRALKVIALIPKYGGGYVPASSAKLARGAGLRELLSEEQLQVLYSTHTPIFWLSEDITEDRAHDLWEYLRYELNVDEVDPEGFVRRLDEGFLRQQSDRWMADFYALLGGQKDLWRRSPLWHDLPFIRLDDGSHTTAFNYAGDPNAYLPPESKTELPAVKREIVDHEDALTFLKAFGLTEADIIAEVVETILPRYKDGADKRVDTPHNERDIATILHALETATPRKRTDLIAKLGRTAFLNAERATDGLVSFRCPTTVYLRTHELEVYFEGNQDAHFLGSSYSFDDNQLALLEELGLSRNVRVERRASNPEGHVILCYRHGAHERGLDGFDPMCEIDGLEHALTHPTTEKSTYVWNRLLIPNSAMVYGVVEMSSRLTYQDSKRSKKYSKMGQIAAEFTWLPDNTGRFCPPSSLALEDLPVEFTRDEVLAKRLQMMPSMLASLAEQSGADSEYVELMIMSRRFAPQITALVEELCASEKPELRASTESGQHIDFAKDLDEGNYRPGATEITQRPSAPDLVGDPERRRKKVAAEIDKDRQNEPSLGHRIRTVLTHRWEPKNDEVHAFLYAQYDGNCQICGFTFPKRDGTGYFEGVYLVPYTEGRWIDRPGNVLCLCANCCAKWLHGSLGHDGLSKQITSGQVSGERADTPRIIRVKLCGQEAEVKFSERHMIELQELVRTAQDKG